MIRILKNRMNKKLNYKKKLLSKIINPIKINEIYT